jgi:methionine-gamma-lyase
MDGFTTRAIRAATRAPRVEQRPTSVPIYQTATFSSADAEELGAVTTGATAGYVYGRLGNPTVDALADAAAELHGAEAGFAAASGMAAIHLAVGSLVGAGDRIVATQYLYGTTRALFTAVLARFGVETAFVDPADPAAVEAALTAAPTQVLYLETISNPTIAVADLPALASLGHGHGAAVVVDNTFASPALCRPLEHGADLVVESATKYLSGHSDVMGGVVAGPAGLLDEVRRVEIDTGATLAPLAAFLVLRGIQTLAVRMDRHAATALALAAWLERQEGVERVRYPGLGSHPQRAVAERQLRSGGGMLSFDLVGGRSAGPAFIDALSVPELTASLGSVHTMVVHPPTTSHRQLDDAGLAAAGITPGLLRCSVGLEDLEDLVEDFGRALRAIRSGLSAGPARASVG